MGRACGEPNELELTAARALLALGRYLHLLMTDLATWSKEYTNQYFQICTLYGIWPA